MRCLTILAALASLVGASILQNGQLRTNPWPGQAPNVALTGNKQWTSHPPNSTELSYKGRWDSKHISWWSAPGLKFGFTGDNVAISFGNYTSPGVLVGYRFAGQDWQFSNVTANATYHFISPTTPGMNLTIPGNGVTTFEMRVTNYAYGVQIDKVWVDAKGKLIKLANYSKSLEIIGDSLSSGYTATYEGLSSYSFGIGAGFGNIEYSVTAYPGVCVTDADCWGNLRGQAYQWYQTSDTSYRATEIYGDKPEAWPFDKHPAADLVLINLGTNDNNTANNVTATQFYNAYVELIEGVHRTWPDTPIVIMSLWNGFGAYGNSYYQTGAFVNAIYNVYEHFNSGEYAGRSFVRYFNTTGILQHNDIAPQYHPTDVGLIKLASHLMQYIKLTFGWEFGATGPEVQHDTLYWNDETLY